MRQLRSSILGVLLFSSIGGGHAAEAAPFTVTCERENVLTGGNSGPLQVTYSGGPEGELAVTSEHVNFSLRATESKRTGVVDGAEVMTTAVQGAAEITSGMPDPQTLLACAAASVQPEFKDDADMFAMAVIGCVPRTVAAPSPVPILASVTVGLIPAAGGDVPDVIVEITRRYLDHALPGGGALEIATFPGNCKLSGM